MEETKKKTTKKISIKNKKVVKSALANASIKGKKVLKKVNSKVSTVKKSPAKVEKEVKEEKKKIVVKTPNNIKKKTTEKPKKEVTKKQAKKKKEEKSFTTRIIFPKEWQSINSKNNKTKTKVKELEEPKTFKGKLKKSIFESIDEKELEERKKKEKEGFKKFLIILLIAFATLGLLVFVLLKYNDFVRRQLAVYKSYRIGDIVYLENDSLWYVVKDADSKEEYVKLLSGYLVDVDGDGTFDTNDSVAYNTENVAEYDASNENSIGYILNHKLKERYEDSIGSIKEISLLTTNEYVKIRERMNFGDEWEEGNWLANDNSQKWWILSNKNDKVYVVSSKGTFFLSSAKNYHFLRPTIVIKKENIKRVEEKKEITLDLINGLN